MPDQLWESAALPNNIAVEIEVIVELKEFEEVWG